MARARARRSIQFIKKIHLSFPFKSPVAPPSENQKKPPEVVREVYTTALLLGHQYAATDGDLIRTGIQAEYGRDHAQTRAEAFARAKTLGYYDSARLCDLFAAIKVAHYPIRTTAPVHNSPGRTPDPR
jgi:hypothetical protein